MADPIGEDGWLALVDEASRTASDLEQRVGVVELYKRSIAAEPWSLKLWSAYCEWVWSLYTDCQTADAGWPEEEQLLGQELFSIDTALDVWRQGAQATQFRLNDSHELWNRWMSIEIEQFSKSRTLENLDRIRKLFLDRLQIPHATWDETSQMLSTFLTKYDEASWESTMVQTSKVGEQAKHLYDKREKRELDLVRAADDVEAQRAVMRDYLDWEGKQARMKPKKGQGSQSPLILVVALYERALSSTLGSDPSIWQDYIVFLGQNSQTQVPSPLSVMPRATQHCPWSGTLWARYILTAETERLPHSDIESIKHAATNTRDLDRDGMAGVVEVYIAWCGYLSRRASLPGAPDEDVDVAEMGLHTALESVQDWGQRLHGKKDYKGDPLFRIERIMIQYLTQKGSFAEARGYWKTLVATHAHSYEFWQQYYLWEMTIRVSNAPPAHATEVLIQAVHQNSLDWPEKMMEVYVRHCNIYADAGTLLTALDAVHWLSKNVVLRREKEAAQAAALYAQQQPVAPETVTESPSGTSKRKRDSASEDVDGSVSKKVKSIEQEVDQAALRDQHLKRDRENTSVLVTNLPADVTQTKVKQYFRDYGHINSLNIKTEHDGLSSTALIEFRSNGDVQSALIRDRKYFTDKQISVVPATGLTLYVTNFPPAADEVYIHDLFKECGEIFSIRWPSLKYNAHRRFCYVTFRTKEAAATATQLDGKILPGGFKLSSLYSDPARKKPREGPMAEGRELHITSLDTSLNEEDLKEVFAKYGSIEVVRLLKNMKGESKGAGFVVFEKKEEANAALALDKTKLKSRVMTVELSTGKNFKPTATSKGASTSPAPDADGDFVMSPSPAPDARTNTHAQHAPSRTEIANRTMALMNIPDTVNDARIRAIVEPFGSIVKLVLRPDHQGAIIEYTDPGAAGRASLGLENYEIAPGRRLRTGGMKDLFREKEEIKTDQIQVGQGRKPAGPFALQPSVPVRRPGGRGGLGSNKRGLGYSGAKSALPGSSAGAERSNGNNGKRNENATPKSSLANADFRRYI